jgi:hypothetical protein
MPRLDTNGAWPPAPGRRRRRGGPRPLVGPGDLGADLHPPEREQRRHRLEAPGVVVVAGHHHDGRDLGQVEQRPVDDAARTRAGGRGLEQVAGHEDEVDRLVGRDPGDLGQHGAVLVGAAGPRMACRRASRRCAGGSRLQPLERVVGGRGARVPGRWWRRSRRTAWPRPGTGTAPPAGTGSWGWLTIIVPGLMMVAAGAARRQEAVLAPGRLGGVEPADDPDGRVGDDPPLDLAGRLLGADEDDAERAAPLGHVEEDLLDRAALAGRVLVELVEHHELQGLGRARAPPWPRTPGAARRRPRSAWPGR